MDENLPYKEAHYVVVTGGVISGLGKGVLTASIAALLKEKYRIICIKCDGYLNADPGTISPIEHGEVYVLDDGGEVDMDFGHYERLIGVRAERDWNITMGKVYQQILENERHGRYLGKTVQLIPHATNEIKERIYRTARREKADIVFIEIGGTIGDLENELFIEAIRQILGELKRGSTLFAHLTYIPIVEGSRELKSKPTQTSVKILNRSGLYPDIIFCRSDNEITEEIKDKISLYCNIEKRAVISNKNVKDINLLPEYFQEQGVDKLIEEKFGLPVPGLSKNKKRLFNTLRKVISEESADVTLKIGICGKYTTLEDSYASVREAILHAVVQVTEKMGKTIHPNILFCNVEDFANEEGGTSEAKDLVKSLSGIIIPGGFGTRGMEGKIAMIRYAREQKIPFMGICLGMQLAVIEFARHVCGITDANTEEIFHEALNDTNDVQSAFPKKSSSAKGSVEKAPSMTPVVHLLDEQRYIKLVGGTMRLGSRPINLRKGSQVHALYGKEVVSERFRHRYEVNSDYIEPLERAGLLFSGMAPESEARIAQIIEIADHPCFIGGQFHPELGSTLEAPSPFFVHFVEAVTKFAQSSTQSSPQSSR